MARWSTRAPDLTGSLNVVFVGEGLAPISIAEGRRITGGGIKRPISVASRSRASLHAHAHYAAHIAESSRLFLASSLHLTCLPAAVFASRCAPTSSPFCRCDCSTRSSSHGALPRSAARTRSAYKSRTRDSSRHPLGAAGGALADMIMVGDSGTDIAVARAGGVRVIAVDFGLYRVPVAKLAPDRIIGHFEVLPAAIEARWAGRGRGRNTDKPVSQVVPIEA